MENKIKLSKKQRQVVMDLQNGYTLSTSSDNKGADVSKSINEQYHISNRVFWNLVDAGMIFQNPDENFHYTLTQKGKSFQL